MSFSAISLFMAIRPYLPRETAALFDTLAINGYLGWGSNSLLLLSFLFR
jgi:hypothetical protein